MMKLCLFFAINLFVLDVSYALNETCTDNTECDTKEKSTCINQTCQCDELLKYSDVLKKCLSYATEYHTLCYEDWQCEDFIGSNSQCINNACLCRNGYRWYQGKCQKFASKGEACNNTIICLDISNPLALNCSADTNTCQCNTGYYDRGNDCRVQSMLDHECAINSDCFPTEGRFGTLIYSHCELGKCIQNNAKKPSNKFNNTFTYSEPHSFLRELMDYTLNETPTQGNDTNCPNGVSFDLTEQSCLECQNTMYFKNTTCICKPGFFLQDLKCVAELGTVDPNTQYTTDKECPIKPGKAVGGVCYCKDYWFLDSTNRECKKTTLEYTRNCLDNDWCKAMGTYAYCNSETAKCQCSSQAVLNETSFYCELKPDANITNMCFDNTACPLYETCSDENCQCDKGFFRPNKTSLCLPEIGYSCEVRDCSHIDNAVCDVSEKCKCKNETFVSDDFVCIWPATQLYDECKIDQQCKNIQHSNCRADLDSKNTTTRCLCSDQFLDVEGICYSEKSPGSPCSTSFNCTVILGDTFQCRNNLCQCPIGMKLNTDHICASFANKQFLHSIMPVFLTLLVLFWNKFE